jgi:hypothetical protein
MPRHLTIDVNFAAPVPGESKPKLVATTHPLGESIGHKRVKTWGGIKEQPVPARAFEVHHQGAHVGTVLNYMSYPKKESGKSTASGLKETWSARPSDGGRERHGFPSRQEAVAGLVRNKA